MANFGLLPWGQSHSPDSNHCDSTILTRTSLGASKKGWVTTPECLVGFELETSQF